MEPDRFWNALWGPMPGGLLDVMVEDWHGQLSEVFDMIAPGTLSAPVTKLAPWYILEDETETETARVKVVVDSWQSYKSIL